MNTKKQWQDTVIKIPKSVPIDTKIKVAILYQQAGRMDEAKQIYLDILSQKPEHATTLHLLGTLEFQLENAGQAVKLINKALVLKPNFPVAQYNLGIVLGECGKLEKAAVAYRMAIKLNPKLVHAYSNLGFILKSQGKLKEAMTEYQTALNIQPDFAMVHSNLILAMNYDARCSQKDIFVESQRWSDIHASSIGTNKHFNFNNRNANRRLRIGYVSPDFREHSVSYFFDSVISEHDRQLFEVFCYSEIAKSDDKTDHFRSLSDGWRSTTGMTDSAVAELIHKDGIDILIDLVGHTAGNRLLVFAEQPAPVQVTWLGYPNTTGLSVMDYRLTDVVADPEGIADTLHTETLMRLPNGFLCFAPSDKASEIGELPALASDIVTFGSFNVLSKYTPEVIETWGRILKCVPKSRLILKIRALNDKKTRKQYLKILNEHNIDTKRIDLCEWTASKSEHLAMYNKVDIGLDPFPYNGTATTCEALWMGVPVITLRGDRHSGRVGASILTQINHEELIAETTTDYIEKAVELANDLTRLSTLRSNLRNQMKMSPLCDPKGFTRDIENAYREMWRQKQI